MTILGGSDSNSTEFAPGGNSPYFYIGQLGYGETAYFTTYHTCGSGDGFNSDTAIAADYVYGFWMLHGPNATPSGLTDYQWGQRQGNAAVTSWLNQGCVNKFTVFADVETLSANKWIYPASTSTDRQKNFDVLLGFGNALIHPADSSAPSLHLGVYCSPNTWNELMGSYTLSQAYASAAWTWRNRNYSSFPTTWNVDEPGENPQSFGGLDPVFWQYDDTATQDFDACRGTSYYPT